MTAKGGLGRLNQLVWISTEVIVNARFSSDLVEAGMLWKAALQIAHGRTSEYVCGVLRHSDSRAREDRKSTSRQSWFHVQTCYIAHVVTSPMLKITAPPTPVREAWHRIGAAWE